LGSGQEKIQGKTFTWPAVVVNGDATVAIAKSLLRLQLKSPKLYKVNSIKRVIGHSNIKQIVWQNLNNYSTDARDIRRIESVIKYLPI